MRRLIDSRKGALTRLAAAHRPLRSDYAAILSLCNTEAAIAEGMFYDLMWVNSRSEHFNPDRQYAFLRHQPGGNTVIVVANFDHEDLTVSVNIPAHAFDYMGIEPSN